MRLEYDWQDWRISLWPTDEGWGWIAGKDQRAVEGDATGTLAQVKLLLAAELQRRDGGRRDVEED